MKRVLAIVMLSAALAALTSCGGSRHIAQSEEENDMINVGYGKVSQKDLTYSVSKVKVRDEEITTYSNIYDYLRGKVPGVSVGTGDNPSIVIRGKGTFYGSSEPLILVDGIEMADISALNPNDVKSVEVLKDSSASIYGVRGANGVILITTKGGR